MSTGGGVAQGPEEIDTTDLHFKSLSKLKVFNVNESKFNGSVNLLAVSQYYGLTFVGTPKGFSVFKSNKIFNATSNKGCQQREVVLNSRPTHLTVDFQQKHLAVACETNVGPVVYIFNISTFLTQGVTPIKTLPWSKPIEHQAIYLCELLWQPNLEGNLTMCFSDGCVSSLNLFQGSGSNTFFLPNTIQARCLCWSPKGKQIVLGCSDGTLSQYKPNLEFVKKLNAPPLFNGAVTVVNVLWVSSFQFAAAYKDASKLEESPVILIVNAPKNEPVNFINYHDITYSSVFYRSHQLYFYHQSAWNLILVASANSIELAVLHAREDNSLWEQWLLGDASRAELPLNNDKGETFPCGIAIDYTSDQAIPWGEESIPPMPRLLLLSNEGVLITFNMINTIRNAPQLCSPPKENFDDSWFTTKIDLGNETKTGQLAEDSPALFNTMKPAEPSAFNSGATSIQDGAASHIESSNLKLQPLKQQVVSPTQQTVRDQQHQLLQTQASADKSSAPIFQYSNAQNTSQKSYFPFSQTGIQSGSESSSAKKDTELLKNVETSNNLCVVKAPDLEQTTKTVEAKDNLTITKTPKQIQLHSTGAAVETKASTSSPGTLLRNEQNKSYGTVANLKTDCAKTSETSPSRSSSDAPTLDHRVYVAALLEEVEQFTSELQSLISRVSNLRFHIGKEDEKLSLRRLIEKITDFQMGLNDTTEGQKNEIHALKFDVLEAFAWLEDARSRNRQRKSPTFIELKKSQNLDPMSCRLMNEISNLKYYIENQLKQLYSYLMKEWMEHQDNCRLDIKMMMTIPSMEELYKTMHLELKILHKQRSVVEELRRRIKEKTCKNRAQTSSTISVRSYSGTEDKSKASELFRLADNLLQIKIDSAEDTKNICTVDAIQIMLKNQINAIRERSKKFTSEKQNILRDILSEREMIKTKSIKSTFASSSFIRNTSARLYSKKFVASRERRDIIPESKHLRVTDQEKAKSEEKMIPSSVDRVPTESEDILKNLSVCSTAQLHAGGQEPSRPISSTAPESTENVKSSEFHTFTNHKSTSVCGAGGEEKSKGDIAGQKTMPFLFKTAPTSTTSMGSIPIVPSEVSSTKSAVTFSTGSGIVPTVSSTNASVFQFKVPEVTCTAGNVQNFSFSVSKAVYAFSPRTDMNFPAYRFGSLATIVTGNSTTSTVFAFNSKESNVASSSKSSLGNTSASFAVDNLVNGSNSWSSTLSFTPPVSEKSSTAGVSTANQPESVSSSPSSVSALSKLILAGSGNLSVEGNEVCSSGISATESGTSVISGQGSSRAPAFVIATTDQISAFSSATAVTTTDVLTTTASVFPTPGADVIASTAPPAAATDTTNNGGSNTTLSVADGVQEGSQLQGAEKGKPEGEEQATVATPPDVLGSAVTLSASAPTLTAEPETNVKANTTQSSGGSVFATTSASSLFNIPPVTATVSFGTGSGSGGSVFGQAVSTAATTSNIFSTTSTSLFSPSKAVSTSSILFGTASSTPTASVFGQATPPASSGNVFGQVTPSTSTGGAFGQSSKDDVGQTAKLFGDVLGGGMSSRSVFETPSTCASGNIFGKTTFDKTSGRIFGNGSANAATTTASTGLFSNTASNIFSKTSFGQAPPSTSANIFGQPQSTESGGTFFGQSISNTYNTFGSSTTASPGQNVFAGGSTFNSKPVFGQSLFGQNTSGQNPFERSSSGSIFGGSTTSTSNIFQSNSFGSLPAGSFSGGQSTSGQSAMGTSSAFQKPMGEFGGAPVFGSSLPTTATFGARPTFGGAPTFGSPPSFGNPQKVFGSSQGTFGQSQTHTPNFEALAGQNDGFANLAQQSQGQAFGGNTFNQNTTFGNDSTFGGTSFSGWR